LTDDDRTTDHRDGIPKLVAQLVEPASFVLGAQSRRTREQFVFDANGWRPTQFRVGPRRGGQILRAVDDAVSGDEYASHCK
jgi:hypothetical protein